MRRIAMAMLGLLLLALVPLATSRPAQALEVTQPVLAYYFGWWGAETWFKTADVPPSLYRSSDDAVMRQQIQQAKSAGITGFICTWRYNCARLLQLAEAEGNFAITISIDPIADPSLNSFDAVVAQMREMAALTASPAYLRVCGKPVFVFWNERILPGDSSVAAFQRLRATVDPGFGQFWLGGGDNFSYLDAFDALHYFQIAWSSTVGPGDAMRSYSRRLAEYNTAKRTTKPFVATVMPGYDDLAYRGGHRRDRENGNFYRASWDAAISYKPSIVVITSWNEWYEGSQIEPSVRYGNLYLDITREKTTQLRAQPLAFADEAFRRTWERTDKAVAEGQVSRSWVWGPLRANGRSEPYNTGSRLVQYFDKSRMEINNPAGDRNSQWFVTNGLLVQEMIDGRVQLGDTTFEQRQPSNEVLAGDGRAGNPDVPGYAALRDLQSRRENRTGQVFSEQLVGGSGVRPITPPATVRAQTFISETGHNIPDVFWSFMNQQGQIWNGAQYVNGEVVSWLFAFGYPITEPYWVRARVGGVEKWVLVQAFQRRVLTFTPDNGPGFQVEMGNVGQHYHQWRYGSTW